MKPVEQLKPLYSLTGREIQRVLERESAKSPCNFYNPRQNLDIVFNKRIPKVAGSHKQKPQLKPYHD
jgi:hypothetical protein